jgi:hypothetical protein
MADVSKSDIDLLLKISHLIGDAPLPADTIGQDRTLARQLAGVLEQVAKAWQAKH